MMGNTFFDRQDAIKLYRSWYIEESKSPDAYYDHEQIESMYQYVSKSLATYIKNLIETATAYAYQIEIPMIYFSASKIEFILNEALVAGNSIQSINMAGCMAVGKDLNEAYDNYLYALIECIDVRKRNNITLMQKSYTFQHIDPNIKAIPRIELINELEKSGWVSHVYCLKNEILINPSSNVTYTIPYTDIIEEDMVFWSRKMMFQISANAARELNSISSAGYWSCDICDGNQDSGCLFYDPTECPRL